MKLIFVDFDGVLAPYQRLMSHYIYTCHDLLPPNGCLMFDPRCVGELNYICNATKAMIVVSSSWRNYIPDLEVMRAMMRQQGVIAPIVGMTPLAQESWGDQSRGAEVLEFMKDAEAESFVILDDCDMGWTGLEDRWVKTDPYMGLTLEETSQAIDILNSSSGEIDER